MEFGEKLQSLRKQKGLTQEELSKALYVSRTAVSKWESGKGYPNIDSLKEISGYFSVSIDDLLSGEKLLNIAEKENRANIKNICSVIFAMADISFILLILLPLYPYKSENYVYSVNLLNYGQISDLKITVYWIFFFLLIILGILKFILIKINNENLKKAFTYISLGVNIILVLFLALSREAYASVITFLILTAKGFIFLKQEKNDK
ncbi:MAG: helix-turn-helix transcriptional regulator [Ruminococcaceae bacterium]|nr:helix-turn-helix transcriptional regulator [Oscillospiraceae bacterium]